jgi:putative N-acetylmannosamine-6-phosphate epimerase
MNRASSSPILAQPLKDEPLNTTELVDAVAEAEQSSATAIFANASHIPVYDDDDQQIEHTALVAL